MPEVADVAEGLDELTIVHFEAANIMRLRAVKIDPEEGEPLVRIMGPNAAGKTSVLDCIWMALGGERAVPDQPVRKGQEKGRIFLDLGKLTIERKFTVTRKKGTTTSLEVRLADGTPDGTVLDSPQSILNQLVGELTLDPFAFTLLDAKDQKAILLKCAGLEEQLGKLDGERQVIFTNRTEDGRKRTEARGALDGVYKDAPTEVPEVPDLTELLEEQQTMTDARTARASADAAVASHVGTMERASADVRKAEDALRAAEAQVTTANEAQAQAIARGAELTTERDALGTEDAERRGVVDAEIREWKDVDQKRQDAEGRAEQQGLWDKYEALYVSKTGQIAAIEERKGELVAGAGLPVPGLGVDAEGVTYRGLPFNQASTAEQLRVSAGLAIQMNPKVRILRVTDGSLLDSESMKVLAELARENGHQIWLEQVLDRDAAAPEGAVVIEDGAVRETDDAE